MTCLIDVSVNKLGGVAYDFNAGVVSPARGGSDSSLCGRDYIFNYGPYYGTPSSLGRTSVPEID